MSIHADQTSENKNQSLSVDDHQSQGSSESISDFVDNRPEAIIQRKLQKIANNHSLEKQLNHPIQLVKGQDDESALETKTLLDVTQQLIADLEGHKRGWLIDIKPKKIFEEIKKAEQSITLLTQEQSKLNRLIEFGINIAKYDNAIRTMISLKNYLYGSTTDQYKLAKTKKKELEKYYEVKGYTGKSKEKNLRNLLGDINSSTELSKEVDETNALVSKLQSLIQEIKDRAIARGLYLEELAKSEGKSAIFPVESSLEEQMTWLETKLQEYPEVAKEAKEDITANEKMLSAAKNVESREKTHEFEAGVYQKLLKDYDALTKPGTSIAQSIKFTFTSGNLLEAGFFVKVSGGVSTGDDREIRPKLAFTVGATVKLDLGIWDASAGLSLTYAMAEGYDGLHHFASHYMRLLSLYELSFKNYIALQKEVNSLKKEDPEYTTKRNEVLKEAKERGFIAENQVIEIGTDEQTELAEMQAKAPVSIKAVKVAIDLDASPNDNATGALSYLGGITFSASYTRKWFTRLVDYAKFVETNNSAEQEIRRLTKIKFDYEKIINELDKTRDLMKMGVLGQFAPALKEREQELEKVKNLYEEGNLTFFRKGRKKFLQEINEKIAALEKGEVRTEEVDGLEIEDKRFIEKNKKKTLTKTGSIIEVEIAGSVNIGSLNLQLGGKYSSITNDKTPDNDGKYLNLSLGTSAKIKGEMLDPDSQAGKDALKSIAEAGEFQDKSLTPSSSSVSLKLIENLAGKTQAIEGLLAGGLKLEINLIWSHGWFRTQYVRLTKNRNLSSSLKAKTGIGANVSFEHQQTNVNFIGERIGTNTLTYVLTVYQGIRKHKDWQKEWNAWANNHKKQLWEILQHIALPMTKIRKELHDLPQGEASADIISQTLKPLCFKQSKRDGHKAELLDFETGSFEKAMSEFEGVMENEFKKRSSINISDLSQANWSSAEGAVNSQVSMDIQLGGSEQKMLSKIKVASKATITNRVKRAQETVEDFSRFRTLQGLMDAGSNLHLKIKTGGEPETIDIMLSGQEDYNTSVSKASKALVKALKTKDKSKLKTYDLIKDTAIINSLLAGVKEEDRLEKNARYDIVKSLDIPINRKGL